jgi:hypothetical protein
MQLYHKKEKYIDDIAVEKRCNFHVQKINLAYYFHDYRYGNNFLAEVLSYPL